MIDEDIATRPLDLLTKGKLICYNFDEKQKEINSITIRFNNKEYTFEIFRTTIIPSTRIKEIVDEKESSRQLFNPYDLNPYKLEPPKTCCNFCKELIDFQDTFYWNDDKRIYASHKICYELNIKKDA
ncbi:MAG: hypothetical protein MUO73_03460 [Thermoplasmata archaeon]|nr:hypothetical protein [Thermoplasmata archaeon]